MILNTELKIKNNKSKYENSSMFSKKNQKKLIEKYCVIQTNKSMRLEYLI